MPAETHDGSHKRTLTRTTQEDRKQTVARMYLEGHVQYTIATLLGISQQTVSKDLELVRQQWLESRIKDYDEKIAKEVAGLDYQESVLWEAWHNSCKQDIVTVVSQKKVLTSRKDDDTTTPSKKGKSKSRRKDKNPSDEDAVVPSDRLIVVEENNKTTTRKLFGDPRFMAEITKVRELRCKLLGLLEDEPLQSPVINIWQQLQELATVRDNDPIEERLLMIEGKTDASPQGFTTVQPIDREVVKASDLPDVPTAEQLAEEEKQRLHDDAVKRRDEAIKKHLNLDWLEDDKTTPPDDDKIDR